MGRIAAAKSTISRSQARPASIARASVGCGGVGCVVVGCGSVGCGGVGCVVVGCGSVGCGGVGCVVVGLGAFPTPSKKKLSCHVLTLLHWSVDAHSRLTVTSAVFFPIVSGLNSVATVQEINSDTVLLRQLSSLTRKLWPLRCTAVTLPGWPPWTITSAALVLPIVTSPKLTVPELCLSSL
jgi:hypothetical protein